MEPWEKVFINLKGVNSVAQLDYHMSELSCVDCHGGDASKPNNMEEAHQDFIARPSEYADDGKNSCGKSGCHEALAVDFQQSLHTQLWGEKKMIAIRAGYPNFSSCPSTIQDAHAGDCASCHAACGDCHISIPPSAGGGFINSHKFSATPSSVNNCMACHGSRIGDDFIRDGDRGHYGDVHGDKYLMDCMECHTASEMHSATVEGTDRYHYTELPDCEDSGCHSAGAALPQANDYHLVHFDHMSCYVCHSQPYNNCTSCHVNGAWKTDENYQNHNPEIDIKIGINPLPSRRFKYATLRHTPVSPDSYKEWNIAEIAVLSNYDALPTWKYTSPHSIMRITSRTDTTGGKSCYENCHIGENGKNKDLYLFDADIRNSGHPVWDDKWADEADANAGVVVDGQLPASWPIN